MSAPSSTPSVQPVGQYVTVALHPEPPKSQILEVVSANADMTQKATILAVGQGVHDLNVGDTVLCRPLQGHHIGDVLLLPAGAVVATVEC